MNVIFISTDRRLFDDSAVRERMKAYGTIFESVHVVVFTLRGFRETALSANVTLYPTNSSSRFFYIWDAARFARIFSKLPGGNWIVSAQDPFEAGLAGLRIARRIRARFQVQIHTDFLSPYFQDRFLNWVRFWIAKYVIPNADCIRVVSIRIKKSVVEAFGIKPQSIAVLPIWDERIAAALPGMPEKGSSESAKFTVLVVSRLEPEKGISDGLRAFGDYRKSGGSGKLIIAGSGSLEAKLKRVSKKLGIDDSVSFLGWQEDVSGLYREADVLLFPSRYDGWGISAYDALKAHLPVVMTDVGLAGEAVLDGINGFVVPVGDIGGMAKALLILEKDVLMRRKLSVGEIRPVNAGKEAYLEAYLAAMSRCA